MDTSTTGSDLLGERPAIAFWRLGAAELDALLASEREQAKAAPVFSGVRGVFVLLPDQMPTLDLGLLERIEAAKWVAIELDVDMREASDLEVRNAIVAMCAALPPPPDITIAPGPLDPSIDAGPWEPMTPEAEQELLDALNNPNGVDALW